MSDNGASFQNQTVTIAESGTTSTAANLDGLAVMGFIIPAAFTGTTMTLLGSDDGTNFYSLVNASGTALSVTVVASSYMLMSATDLMGMRYLKLVSGSSEAAARSVGIITRSVE